MIVAGNWKMNKTLEEGIEFAYPTQTVFVEKEEEPN